MVTGNTPDISEYICFNWFQPVWYYDNTSFPEPTKHLARWIGVAHNIRQAMCFWVLPPSGVPIARSTVQAISEVELRSAEVQEQIRIYDETIRGKLAVQSDSTEPFMVTEGSITNELQQANEADDGFNIPLEPDAEKPNPDDFNDEETYSRFTSAEVLLPKGDYEFIAKVTGRKRDSDGNPIGRYHPNPHQDGNRWLLLKEIIGHEKDATAPTGEQLLLSNRRFTTKGWSLHCLWADGSTSWEALRNLKESNPLEVAQYAEQHNLLNEPAFSWWAKHVLKRSQ